MPPDEGTRPSLSSLTPLSWAAQNGHEGIMRLLLETGEVDADSKDKYSWTRLSHATQNGHESIVKLLLDTGKIDADSKDVSSRTPLSYQYKHSGVFFALKSE
jgi:ankyrin repeat protein